jgi:hypothetical protein
MKQHKIATAISVMLAIFGTQIPASAATFSVDNLGITITMTGEIKSGDAERLSAIFTKTEPLMKNVYIYPNSLHLNSPGGDVSEAIRIADLVKTLGISVATSPDGNGVCASSCFLIYAAALERVATGIDTLQTEGPKGNLSPLGIHRPFLRVPTEGPDGAQKQEQVMSDMRAYLAKAGVGHTLIDKMMSRASNDIYWLNAEDVRSLGEFSPGVEEQLIAKCGYNSRRESNLSARDYIRASESGVLECMRSYMVKIYTPLMNTAVDRMRKGWRPWKK